MTFASLQHPGPEAAHWERQLDKLAGPGLSQAPQFFHTSRCLILFCDPRPSFNVSEPVPPSAEYGVKNVYQVSGGGTRL